MDIVEAIFLLHPRPGHFSIESLAQLAIAERGRAATFEEEIAISETRKSLYNGLLQRQEEIAKSGGLRSFDIASSAQLRLLWINSSTSDRRHWHKLVLRSCVARWLHGLDDRSYEFASGLAMQVLGAELVHITPRGKDYGIDFLALVPAYTRSGVFMSGTKGIRIVGQSKKFNSPVPREKIQAFDSCLTDIRHDAFHMTTMLPTWFRSSASRIVSCFIAHAGLQSGGMRMSQKLGYVVLDTMALAEIISTLGLRHQRAELTRTWSGDEDTHRGLWSRLYALGYEP